MNISWERTFGLTVWLLFQMFLCGCGGRDPLPTPAVTVAGPSAQFDGTIIVPTLDTAIPDHTNVAWSAAFQLAWAKMNDDVLGEPVRLEKALAICDRLNRSDIAASDVSEDDYLVAAGIAGAGVMAEIESQMQSRFEQSPRTQMPPLSPESLVIYAYLQANMKFKLPFFQHRRPHDFTASDGTGSAVASFGIHCEQAYSYYQLREQVDILYVYKSDPRQGIPDEFVLDPCRTSDPYQLVIAVVPRGRTLAETVENAERKCRRKSDERGVGPNDELVIPDVFLDTDCEFDDLLGATVLNSRYRDFQITMARQTIAFRLDRGGVELGAEAEVAYSPVPTFFHVTGPFLVYLKRRGTSRPFFALWVDNAEILREFVAEEAIPLDEGTDHE